MALYSRCGHTLRSYIRPHLRSRQRAHALSAVRPGVGVRWVVWSGASRRVFGQWPAASHRGCSPPPTRRGLAAAQHWPPLPAASPPPPRGLPQSDASCLDIKKGLAISRKSLIKLTFIWWEMQVSNLRPLQCETYFQVFFDVR